MDVAAVVVAAGRGARATGEPGLSPKQYRSLAGASVLARVWETLAAHPRIEGILTVIHPDDRAAYERECAPFASRLLAPVAGGATRQDSVRAGLEALAPAAPRWTLLHDAARPFVTADVIDRVLDALARHDGAVPALPVAETLKRAEARRIVATVDRAGLWAAQTPQGFHYAKVLAAHRAAADAGKSAFTDDAAIAEWYGLDVALVEGAAANRKLTTAADFADAERLLQGPGATEWRVGHGYDVHAFGPGDHVTLCGVRLAHERGLVGHSDADVGLHALTDALLGALGEGDIGQHFPPEDDRWRGADSVLFLREAAARLAARGGRVANVDLTAICEAPRIGPHRDAMRARIAEILAIEPARVSVKATTTEGLGFTGRREGIAVQAVVMARFD